MPAGNESTPLNGSNLSDTALEMGESCMPVDSCGKTILADACSILAAGGMIAAAGSVGGGIGYGIGSIAGNLALHHHVAATLTAGFTSAVGAVMGANTLSCQAQDELSRDSMDSCVGSGLGYFNLSAALWSFVGTSVVTGIVVTATGVAFTPPVGLIIGAASAGTGAAFGGLGLASRVKGPEQTVMFLGRRMFGLFPDNAANNQVNNLTNDQTNNSVSLSSVTDSPRAGRS